MATLLTCVLECEHEIEWGESPGTPGAALPHCRQIVPCPECGTDQEVVHIDPRQVTLDQIDRAGAPADAYDDTRPQARIVWDSRGWFSFRISGTIQGIYCESDTVGVHESEAEARSAALHVLNR